MSSETVQTAPEQPAQVEQISSEKKGAGNTSFSDFARSLAAKQTPPPAFAPKQEVTPPTEAKAPEAQKDEPKEVQAEVTTEEPKEEAQAETVESEEEASEVLSHETPSLDPKLQAKIDRRIGKEVAKRKALEQEVAALKQLVTEKPQEVEKEIVVPVPSSEPLAQITSIEALNQYKESLSADILEAEMLLYSDFPPEGKATKWGHLTKDALISALTQAKKEERIAIPAREKFLTTRSQVMQTAQEKFPFLKDPTHPGYQMAKQALRDNPVLRTYPNSDYLVGVLVKGMLAMQAEEGAQAPKTPVKLKPKPTSGQAEISSDASPTRAPVGVANKQALDAEISRITGGKKSLNAKDFAAVLRAKQTFRNSQ